MPTDAKPDEIALFDAVEAAAARARRHALALPDAAESAHFGKADFRVAGKIFACLPEPGLLVVKLTREQQEMLTGAEPAIFSPVPNAWGRKGWTRLALPGCPEDILRHALQLGWGNVAGRRRLAALTG